MTPRYTPPAVNGDTVICLHSSMSSSRQWDQLMQRLQGSYRVLAIDLHGYGNGPEWTADSAFSLDREVSLLDDLVAEQDTPIHLVGHSYGGAVAIRAAQAFAPRIRSLTLYEPVIFAALFATSAGAAASAEVSLLIEEMQQDYRRGDLLHAAHRFIDYWSGTGTWASFSFHKKLGLAQKIPTVLGNFEATIAEPHTLAGLAQLQVPTLYLAGRESPASVQAITALLKNALPHAETHHFHGMGHMGPITHGERVNTRIELFLERLAATSFSTDLAHAA